MLPLVKVEGVATHPFVRVALEGPVGHLLPWVAMAIRVEMRPRKKAARVAVAQAAATPCPANKVVKAETAGVCAPEEDMVLMWMAVRAATVGTAL